MESISLPRKSVAHTRDLCWRSLETRLGDIGLMQYPLASGVSLVAITRLHWSHLSCFSPLDAFFASGKHLKRWSRSTDLLDSSLSRDPLLS